jgi:hypothetical protein
MRATSGSSRRAGSAPSPRTARSTTSPYSASLVWPLHGQQATPSWAGTQGDATGNPSVRRPSRRGQRRSGSADSMASCSDRAAEAECSGPR